VDFLKIPSIAIAFAAAWQDSLANDSQNRHEEGGYVVLRADQSMGVERWVRGEGSTITPAPLDANNC
jgi:hypothetical protein